MKHFESHFYQTSHTTENGLLKLMKLPQKQYTLKLDKIYNL